MSKLNRGVEPDIRPLENNSSRADMDQTNAVSGDNRSAINDVIAIDSSQIMLGRPQ